MNKRGMPVISCRIGFGLIFEVGELAISGRVRIAKG
jgi:hypothetical protein